MLDPVTNLLYNDSYPREIGKKRYLCKTREEFEKRLDLLNGVDEAFSNVNPINGSINKIFIDFDGAESLHEAQKMYITITSLGIPSIPVASGKKGVHLYCMFKTHNGENAKEILFKTTKSLIIKTFGEGYQSKTIDAHVVGDLRRLGRIPNTLRPPENQTFCTPLPPSKAFIEMRNEDLQWYIKGTHTYPKEAYNFENGLPTFGEHILPQVQEMKVDFLQHEQASETSPLYGDSERLKMLLENFPCLYRVIAVQEPRHASRVAVVALLKLADFSTREILDLLRPLRWCDWSEEYTAFQIEHIKPMRWSKQALITKGICFKCGKCS